MNELETFRDHAHNMATGHAHDCPSLDRPPLHAPRNWKPTPCDGSCQTDADRALWTRLADEITDYLERGSDELDLFGNTSPTNDTITP